MNEKPWQDSVSMESFKKFQFFSQAGFTVLYPVVAVILNIRPKQGYVNYLELFHVYVPLNVIIE